MKKLTKMPIDVEALLSSKPFGRLRDFQKWWAHAIWYGMWNQRMPGYFEITESLCSDVSCQDAQFFYGIDKKTGRRRWDAVLELFAVQAVSGKRFLYSEKIEKLWHEQQKKYASAAERGRKGGEKISLSRVFISSSAVDLIYQDYPRHRNPEEAKNQIRKAIQKLIITKYAEFKDRFGNMRMVPIENQTDAEKFLHESVLEFRESPEGKKSQEFIVYPERWFKRQCYLEPRGEWFVEKQGPKKFKSVKELYGLEDEDD